MNIVPLVGIGAYVSAASNERIVEEQNNRIPYKQR